MIHKVRVSFKLKMVPKEIIYIYIRFHGNYQILLMVTSTTLGDRKVLNYDGGGKCGTATFSSPI